MELTKLLEAEIKKELEKCEGFDIATPEHKSAVTDLATLTDRFIRLKEIELDKKRVDVEKSKAEIEKGKLENDKQKSVDAWAIECRKLEAENEKLAAEQEKIAVEREKNDIERAKMEDERKDRKVKNIISIASLVVPTALVSAFAFITFIFEEKGTIPTSVVGRKVVDKMFRLI